MINTIIYTSFIFTLPILINLLDIHIELENDEIMHLGTYALWAFIFIFESNKLKTTNFWNLLLRKFNWILAIILGLFVGCVDELVQFHCTNRTSSFHDLSYDLLGLTIVAFIKYTQSTFFFQKRKWQRKIANNT